MQTLDTLVALPPEPWQEEDLDLLAGKTSTANWSEMGCKKTSTGLWDIKRKMEGVDNPNVLIVTTKAGKGTFFQLAPLLMEGYTIFNVTTAGLYILMNGKEIKLPKVQFVPKRFDLPVVIITNYDVFSRCNYERAEKDEEGRPLKDENGRIVWKPWTQGDHIISRRWNYVWFDEVHKIKNRDTRWTQNVKKIKADFKHVSTGTGFINRPDEIWSSLNYLDKERFGSYWDFRDEFCLIDDWDGYATVVGVKPEKKEEFRKIVRYYGPRRTLDEVMPHIKRPIHVAHDVELSTAQRRIYNQIKAELMALDEKGTPFYTPNVLSLLSRLRQISVATPEVIADYYDEKEDRRVFKIKLVEPSSKLDAVMDIIEGLEWDEESKQPLVVFSCFSDPLELLKIRLEKANVPYIWMKQNDNDQERYRKWAIEFPKLRHRVFMSTLQLGSESINLTPARHCVFLDRSWSPKDNSQGIGRIRRPGQEGQPVVININAKRTTDQRIESVNKTKQGWFNEIFGDEE